MARRRWVAAGTLVLGGGLAVNSVLGPFVADVIDYPLSETLINQTVGLDAFSLIAVGPLSVVAAWLLVRGQAAGAVVALGIAAYAAYMLVQYVAGPAYLEVPGVLTLQLGLLIVAGATGVAAWSSIDREALPGWGAKTTRRVAVAMFVAAGFVVARYIPILVGSASGEAIPEESLADPTMFWLIVVLDLAAVVPAAVAAGVGLLRRAAWAPAAAFAVAGWFAIAPPSIAVMAIAMLVRDDPYATTGTAVLLLVAAAVFLGFAVWLFRPLFRGAHASTG